MIEKKELEYWKKEFPDLDEDEIVLIMELFEQEEKEKIKTK